MKFLKGLVKGILVFLLINLLTVLTFSFTMPKVITNGLLRDIVVRGMLNKVVTESTSDSNNNRADVDVNDNSVDGTDVVISDNTIDEARKEVLSEFSGNKELEELLYSKEVEDLLNKYFNAFIDGLADDNVKDVDVEEDIVNFVSNHRGELQKISNEEITDEDIEDLRKELRNSDTNSQFKKFIQDTKRDVPDSAKDILSGFKFFISTTFRLIIIIIIAIDIALIALIDLSLRKTIKTVGVSMNTCGGMMIIFGLAAKFIIEKIVEAAADDLALTNVSIDTSSLVIAGIVLLVIGIVLCIIAYILKKTKNNKNNANTVNNSLGQGDLVNNTNVNTQLQPQQNVVNNNTSNVNPQIQSQDSVINNNVQFPVQGNVINNTNYDVQSGNQMNGVNGGSEKNNDLS